MKKNITLIILLLGFLWAHGQNEIKSLKVGERLPDAFWQTEHNVYTDGKVNKQTLAQYKGKLLILNFWATWCSTCLKSMSLVDSLVQLDMKMLPVVSLKTKVSLPDIQQFYYSNKDKLYTHNTIFNDEVLSEYFPFREVPHYVWIGYNGKVLAITNYLFSSSALIKQILDAQNKSFLKNHKP